MLFYLTVMVNKQFYQSTFSELPMISLIQSSNNPISIILYCIEKPPENKLTLIVILWNGNGDPKHVITNIVSLFTKNATVLWQNIKIFHAVQAQNYSLTSKDKVFLQLSLISWVDFKFCLHEIQFFYGISFWVTVSQE